MTITKTILTSAAAIAALSCGALAEQAQSGSITKVDEANCRVTIQPTQGSTVGAAAIGAAEDFKLPDSLLFSALQPGDRLVFTAAEVRGIKTITNLQKQ